MTQQASPTWKFLPSNTHQRVHANVEPRQREALCESEVVFGKFDHRAPTNPEAKYNTVTGVPRRQLRVLLAGGGLGDWQNEMDLLFWDVVPFVKNFARSLGLELVVTHMGFNTHLALKDDPSAVWAGEKLAKRLKTAHTHSICVFGERYGEVVPPETISSEDFEEFRNIATDQDLDFLLLEKWYIEDANFVPPRFCLRALTSQDDWMLWREDAPQVLDVLLLVGAHAHKDSVLSLSPLEHEIRTTLGLDGLARTPSNSQLLFLSRVFINHPASAPAMSEEASAFARFFDVDDSDEGTVVTNALQTHSASRLRLEAMSALPADRVKQFEVHWSHPTGLALDSDDQQRQYFSPLANTILDSLVDLIAARAEDFAATNTLLFEDIATHWHIAARLAQLVVERQDVVDSITSYVEGIEEASTGPPSSEHRPLLVTGPAGTGKSAALAAAVKHVKDSESGRLPVVLRFCGQTLHSKTPEFFLQSLCQHLANLSRTSIPDPPSAEAYSQFIHKQLQTDFNLAHLVLFIDDLGSLFSDAEGKDLQWLPQTLPPNIRVVVSASETKDAWYRSLRSRFENRDVVYVSAFTPDTCNTLTDEYLATRLRSVQASQRLVLEDCFHHCPLPGAVKTALDIASHWTSSTFPSPLPTTPPGLAREFIESLKQRHGLTLVGATLSLFACSRHGLTRNELEDLLSCDETVLCALLATPAHMDSDRFDPAVRRVPHAPLEKMMWDLEPQLEFVDASACGAPVMRFTSPHVAEVAKQMFLKDENKRGQVHKMLAEYFNGTYAQQPLPFVAADGSTQEIDRRMPHQPWVFQGMLFNSPRSVRLNCRKLSEQVYHEIHSGLLDRASTSLSNMEYIHAKTMAGLVLELHEELGAFMSTAPPSLVSEVSDYAKLVGDKMLELAASPAAAFELAMDENYPAACKEAMTGFTKPMNSTTHSQPDLRGARSSSMCGITFDFWPFG